uniref:C2H2-type domain-containing protein n=1 Tax=Cyclopterus lumpus TaxID=8103 RepID=A0A8C3ARE1_CYCLU
MCKTISCLLPTDLEVKRACQLTEFLLQPTVDSYYAVESLYNEPDQKPEEDESLPVPNSLRCELLLAFKTQWPFDPEFWDWKTLKRNCLALMGEEAFLGHRIVRHAQKHFKDGVYLCPICADSFETREILEPHVASHVKQSCKERLAAMKAARKVTKPPQSPKSPSKMSKVAAKVSISPVKIEPHIGDQLVSPVKIEQTTSDTHISQDCFCPVKNCSKAFKFFRNLMAHVRSHKDDEEKVVCQYCRRQFVNVRHLNDHLQMHCGSKPYICIQLDCKANFNSNSELLMHRKTHPEFKAQCMFPNCGQVFSEAYLLYDHEAQHYLTYTCQTENCGKIFYSQAQFLSHQDNHSTDNAVDSFPITNQNPPDTSKVEPPPESTQSNENNSSAVVCIESIDMMEKYNKVAKITAKKAPSGPISPSQSQNQGNRPSNQPGILCNKPGMQQMDFSMASSTSPAQCYPGSMEPVPITPMVNPTLYPSW